MMIKAAKATKGKKERAPPLLKYAINIWVCEE